jgi:tetratricopeptide (TPR) repeat protein
MGETESASDLWQNYEDTGNEAYAHGRYAEAEQQFKSARTTADAFGADDPRLATSLNSLGELYRAQGQHVEAEPLLKRALELREEILDSDDPHLAQSLNNLAALYAAQGRFAEAEPLCHRAVEVEEDSLGRHP